MADNEDILLEVGGESISLADLAGIDMDAVTEVRTSTFPAGAFKMKVETSKLEVFGQGADKKAGIAMRFKCTDVITLIDDTLTPNDIIDKVHQEVIWMSEPLEALGRTKAFMADTGFKGSGKLQELLEAFAGTEFSVVITHNTDKNDKSRIYSNIGLNIGNWKVAPAGEKLPK